MVQGGVDSVVLSNSLVVPKQHLMMAGTWEGSQSRVDSTQLFALNFYKQVVSVCSLEPANRRKDLLTTNASALYKL